MLGGDLGLSAFKTFLKKKLEGEEMVSIVRTPFDTARESVVDRSEGKVLWSF
jgi:hypothetical protein